MEHTVKSTVYSNPTKRILVEKVENSGFLKRKEAEIRLLVRQLAPAINFQNLSFYLWFWTQNGAHNEIYNVKYPCYFPANGPIRPCDASLRRCKLYRLLERVALHLFPDVLRRSPWRPTARAVIHDQYSLQDPDAISPCSGRNIHSDALRGGCLRPHQLSGLCWMFDSSGFC